MATQPPTTPPSRSKKDVVPPSPVERATNFLGWAFVISILIHLVLGPIVGQYNPSHSEDKEVEKVSVSKKTKVIVPTPPPPTPPPTPPPKQTPPPVKATNPPPQPKLKVNVVHTTSKSNTGPSEAKYDVKQGSQEGVPQGVATSAGTAKSVATPGPPVETPTPKPACAQPHVDATTTNPVSPDTPEMAKQQGLTGTSMVKVSLSATGSVLGATIYKSSGSALLDNAAVQAAKESSYSPEIDNCAKVAGDYIFRADFEGN